MPHLQPFFMIVLLKALAVLFLVFLNGFFVASEFAIVKIRETRLIELAKSGNLRARVAEAERFMKVHGVGRLLETRRPWRSVLEVICRL
ncbi:MAG: CNNM domain-containing protein [bacterium]